MDAHETERDGGTDDVAGDGAGNGRGDDASGGDDRTRDGAGNGPAGDGRGADAGADRPGPAGADGTGPGPGGTVATRAAATRQGRELSDLVDRQSVTLESLLAVLRSSRLDDRAARTVATEIAANAMVAIRTETDQQRDLVLEPVVGAFARLQNDLRPLVRFGGLAVQFVEPPATGRALPGEVAHAARAIVRNAVLTLVDTGASRRVRIQWDCDGLNLLIDIRDDGEGSLTVHDDALRPIAERVSGLDGSFTVHSTEGWGSQLSIKLPLDPPSESESLDEVVALSPREREVLHLVAAGGRNRSIAADLGISENTVKFHVANLLRKAGAANRAELAALGR